MTERVYIEIGDRGYDVEVSCFHPGDPSEPGTGEIALGPRAWAFDVDSGYQPGAIPYESVLAEKAEAADVDRLTADRMLHDEAYEQMCDHLSARAEEAGNW